MPDIKVPLIPLPNVVFFPKTALPLFIDEPVYGKMVRDCVANNTFLALSQAFPFPRSHDPYSNEKPIFRPAQIGSIGMPYILEEYNGGAIKVLVKGLRRVQVFNVAQSLPYPIYNARIIPEGPSEEGVLFGKVNHINRILVEWVEKNVTNSLDREAFLNGLESIEHIVNYVAMLLIRDNEIRQMLLETDSLVDRVNLISVLLERGIPLKENPQVARAMKNFEILERFVKAAQ